MKNLSSEMDWGFLFIMGWKIGQAEKKGVQG